MGFLLKEFNGIALSCMIRNWEGWWGGVFYESCLMIIVHCVFSSFEDVLSSSFVLYNFCI